MYSKLSRKSTDAVAVLILVLLEACIGRASAGPPLKAVTVDQAPVIDGDLSDPCWQAVQPVTGFYYISTGSPGTEPTTAWIAYDQKNVYVAFDCKDSQPQSIRAQQKKRGGNLWSDDNVSVYLDLFSEYRGDRLSYFTVSAGGTQAHEVRSAETAKTEWAGDWDAAAKRNTDGYSVEMRIPFSILRYDHRNPKISVAFERNHERLDQQWLAPDLGKNCDLSKFYFWEGLRPPECRPRPVTLIYALAGAGSDDSPKRLGLDFKHSLTPSITGLLTLNPDFRNVEQQVDSVDFTYTERVLSDNRVFFQESRQYFPGSPLYYTRRIGEIDAGLKAVGMSGDYQLGFANTRRFGHESYTVAEIGRLFGANKGFSVWTGGVLSEVEGSDNLAAFFTLDYKWRHAQNRATDFHYTIMNTDDKLGSGHGDLRRFTAETDNGPRKLGFEIEHNVVDSDFQPYLGAGRDLGIKSLAGKVELWDNPQVGPISNWYASLYYSTADHLDGSRFQKLINPSASIYWRRGRYVNLGYSDYERDQYHDQVWNVGFGWKQNDLYRCGGIGLSFGNRVGGDYRYASLSQGLHLSDHLSAQLWTEYSKIGAPSPSAGTYRQTVVSAIYDITPERGVVGRLVRREGKSNAYFAYRQKVRAGMDAYLIYGDPNAEETQDTVLLKLIWPM